METTILKILRLKMRGNKNQEKNKKDLQQKNQKKEIMLQSQVHLIHKLMKYR